VFDWEKAIAGRSRRQFLRGIADTDTLVLPAPTAGRVEADGERFRYRFRAA